MKLNSHWYHAGLTFILTVLLAGISLPWIRIQPASVHKYFCELSAWVRISFVFFLCTLFTGSMFKLLSPQGRQIAYCRSHPPSWIAAILAWMVVAVIDVAGGFAPTGYRATIWEWAAYGGGALLIVGCYSGLWREIHQCYRQTEVVPATEPECVTIQDIQNAPWEEIESWLVSDESAKYDFLGNQSVAHRVCLLISDGARSIGIVGPYGAGKTSVVTWVKYRLEKYGIGGRRYFVCHHSCWGFETSASAISEMLNMAISTLRQEVDTFQIDSLPDSYRQTFSVAGDWVEAISNLILPDSDPMGQFSSLSDLLEDIGGRIVFIVEDLDRNETRSFEIQEVLAFLERLKRFKNLRFILTGGLSSSQQIDYTKLCDHIETLRTINPLHSSSLVTRVRQHCLDAKYFPHIHLEAPSDSHEWDPLSGSLFRNYEVFSLPQAVAHLLYTPRTLRHALGRTFSAWRTLRGEIDFDQLLAVNILRFGAPECFLFLIRRWDRLRSPPERNPTYGKERLDIIKQAIIDDWTQTIRNVEWNPTSALRIMKFILPEAEKWLENVTFNGLSRRDPQLVSAERYWTRAINEALEIDDVRDQEVLTDFHEWKKSPGIETELVANLTSSSKYSDVWEDLASSLFVNQREQILLLCEQVIQRLLRDNGSSAGSDSQGFIHTWRFASSQVSDHPGNKAWLQDRISEAAQKSIEMVRGLWLMYGVPGRYSILHPGDGVVVRQHVIDTLRKSITDGSSLVARLSPKASATLYALVFDLGHDSKRILADVQSWSWLGQPILDALRNKNVLGASECLLLLGASVSGREKLAVDTKVLDAFFGNDAKEVIDIIESMIDQLPEADHSMVKNVVGAARIHFAGGTISNIDPEDVDAD